MSVDLTTNYLGLRLKNPLVASAGPVTEHPELLHELDAVGIAAVVLPSLWEEQIEHYDWQLAQLEEYGANSFPEALNYFPPLVDRRGSPDDYLSRVMLAKQIVKVPVIASLNGRTRGGWVRYARMIQEAGADALELNVYFLATDPNQTSAEVEQQYLDLVAAVRAEVTIPLAVKIGPFFSSLPNFAKRLMEAGADGLVFFNRFLQPDIDLNTLAVAAHATLSDSRELRLPLRWIAILRSVLRCSLAATSGVHTPADVIKLILAGADAVQVMSVLMQRGVGHVRELLEGISRWMAERDYESLEQMKGSLCQANCPDPAAFERANYMKALVNYAGIQV
ncbi:MAG: dihydroorotate dehydrogenase-like protein [Gemmataceae bacterium]|nr:dihydroorotate dehydrogenase-like protein [Gemmataceae bacterium]